MKTAYIITGILILVVLAFFIPKSRPTGHMISSSDNNGSLPDTGQVKRKKIDENPYARLRQQAFTVTPDLLKLDLPDDQTSVFGVIMDWDVGDAIATVVAFQTGDASVYLSTGQIFIGGYAHETIVKSSKDFVDNAQKFVENSEKTEDISNPDKGCVKFYLLTNKGTFMHQEVVSDIEHKKNNWTVLFDKGNQLITEYRLMTGEK